MSEPTPRELSPRIAAYLEAKRAYLEASEVAQKALSKALELYKELTTEERSQAADLLQAEQWEARERGQR